MPIEATAPYAAERGEFLLSGDNDFARLSSFFSGLSLRQDIQPRIFIDPTADSAVDILGRLGKYLADNQTTQCTVYTADTRDEDQTFRTLYGTNLRKVFTHVFFLGMAGELPDAQGRIARVAAVHRIPEMQKIVFSQVRSFLRRADAWPLDTSLGELAVPISEAVKAARAGLPAATLFAAGLVISEFVKEVTDQLRQLDALNHKTCRSLWNNTNRMLGALVAFLHRDTLPGMENLARINEAGVFLKKYFAACGFRSKPRFAELLIGDKATIKERFRLVHHLRRHAKRLEQEEGDVVRRFTSIKSELSRVERLKRWSIRRTELSVVRRNCRKLCLFLERAVRSDAFLSCLMLWLSERAWKECEENKSLAREGTNGFMESLRRAGSELRGGTVFLILPRGLAVEEDAVGRVEHYTGRPCEVVEVETADAWLYWEDRFIPPEKSAHDWKNLDIAPPLPSDLPSLDNDVPSKSEFIAERVIRQLKKDRSYNSLCTCDTEAPGAAGGIDQPPPITCPRCGGFNWRYWWRCYQHGKVPIEVSCGEERCPDCIIRCHEDPAHFPLESISRRPDLLNVLFCPHCGAGIDAELIPFFKDGVAGYQRRQFLILARRLGLPNDCRCPVCWTLLIPVHHRGMQGHKLAVSRPSEEVLPEPLPWPEPSGILSGMEPDNPMNWSVPAEAGLESLGSEPKPGAGDGREDIEDNVGLANP